MPTVEAEVRTLHLREPFRIAHGASASRQVLRVYSGGAVGEAPLVPYYQEDPEAALEWVRGRREGSASQAGRLALDLLERDLDGKPLWWSAAEVLGSGRPWEKLSGCRSLGIPEDLDDYRRRVAEVAATFPVIKVKLGSGDLDYDEAVVAAARSAAPLALMIADVNGGWSVDDTLIMLERLHGYRLELVEQPVHHREGIEAWRELHARRPPGGMRLFADESARGAVDVAPLAGLVDGVNVKLLKCGTFGGSIEMIAAAREHGLGVILGCMIESSIGITAAAHLAPWADYIDLDGHLYLADDDYEGLGFDAHGHLVMPMRPGIGVRRRAANHG